MTAQGLLMARMLRMAGWRIIKNHQNLKVQENNSLHMFEDLTNASVLSGA